jgi:hypothetical protein
VQELHGSTVQQMHGSQEPTVQMTTPTVHLTTPNGAAAAPEGVVKAKEGLKTGPRINDTCMACGHEGACIDDGSRVLCEDCLEGQVTAA